MSKNNFPSEKSRCGGIFLIVHNCDIENFVFIIMLAAQTPRESSSFTFFDGEVQVNRNFVHATCYENGWIVSVGFLRASRGVK